MFDGGRLAYRKRIGKKHKKKRRTGDDEEDLGTSPMHNLPWCMASKQPRRLSSWRLLARVCLLRGNVALMLMLFMLGACSQQNQQRVLARSAANSFQI